MRGAKRQGNFRYFSRLACAFSQLFQTVIFCIYGGKNKGHLFFSIRYALKEKLT